MLPSEARALSFLDFPDRALRNGRADILFSIAFSHHPDLVLDPLISQKNLQGENRSVIAKQSRKLDERGDLARGFAQIC